MLALCLLGCALSAPSPADGPRDTGVADSDPGDTDPPDTEEPADTETDDVDTDTEADTDTGAGADTGGDTDTGAAEWVAPELGCALTAPMDIDPAALPELQDLRGPDYSVFYGLGQMAALSNMWYDCPMWDGAFYAGPCEGGTLSWDGRYTTVPYYEGESLHVVSGDTTIDMDGIFNNNGDEVSEDYTYSRAGSSGTQESWIMRAVGSGFPGGWTLEWQASYGLPGEAMHDYCVAVEVDETLGCGTEPWGGWVIEGASRVVATYDPDTVCDGCANVTVDGVDAGTSCDPFPT